MKKFALLSSVVLSGALLANQVQANEDFASGLYIAPGINGLVVKDGHKDNDPNIANMRKNKPGANLSFGYQFDNPWAVEFMYQYNKPRVRNSDEKVKSITVILMVYIPSIGGKAQAGHLMLWQVSVVFLMIPKALIYLALCLTTVLV